MRHGTKIGYLTHILADELPCLICVNAEAARTRSLVS